MGFHVFSPKPYRDHFDLTRYGVFTWYPPTVGNLKGDGDNPLEIRYPILTAEPIFMEFCQKLSKIGIQSRNMKIVDQQVLELDEN